MQKRHFLNLSCAFCAVLKAISRGGTVDARNSITELVADRRLAEFLHETREERLRLYRGHKELELSTREKLAESLEHIANKKFKSEIDRSSRRHQFYLGKIYYELFQVTSDQKFLDLGLALLTAAESQGHPDAITQQIKGMPCAENREKYLKAINFGSVSALAICSGAVHAAFESHDWMKVGPLINFPEQAGVERWSELFINWMIIYHFIIQWDKSGKYFRLSLPNQKVLEIVSGQQEVSESYREEFSWDFMRECAEVAAVRASKIDTDFYPEEIYSDIWNGMFRFKTQWSAK
jgi:hypothetical protein